MNQDCSQDKQEGSSQVASNKVWFPVDFYNALDWLLTRVVLKPQHSMSSVLINTRGTTLERCPKCLCQMKSFKCCSCLARHQRMNSGKESWLKRGFFPLMFNKAWILTEALPKIIIFVTYFSHTDSLVTEHSELQHCILHWIQRGFSCSFRWQ